MPRLLRVSPAGLVHHVLNRGAGRRTRFEKPVDYQVFQTTLVQAQARSRTPGLCYGEMPDYWYLLLWPPEDGELSRWERWLSVTHSQMWHSHHGTLGSGPVYQGRFRAFPFQSNSHILAVARYGEGNSLRAKLVRRAENSRWTSLWCRRSGNKERQRLRSKWPVAIPSGWLTRVNQAQPTTEREALGGASKAVSSTARTCWQTLTIACPGVASTIRPVRRPRKDKSRHC